MMIGLCAVAAGIVLGLGLTKLVGNALINMLDLSITHFSVINTTAIAVTTLFFIIVFAIMAKSNASKVVYTLQYRIF